MNIIRQFLEYIRGTPDTRQGAVYTRRIIKEWTRDELEEALAAMVMQDNARDWFKEYYIEKHENERLRRVLKADYPTQKEINHALHMADLEEKNRRLREEVRTMQEAAEKHNRELFATGLIVHCTGCESGAPANGDELTEEKVQEVERIAARLRTWFNGHKRRQQRKPRPATNPSSNRM